MPPRRLPRGVRARSAIAIVVAAVSSITGARAARAWGYAEHVEIGRNAYETACRELGRRLSSALTPPANARYHIACGPFVFPLPAGAPPPTPQTGRAFVYGQAGAISGDLLANPEEFFSALGGERVLNVGSYWSLALVNSSHFHPENVRNWRRHHVAAVRDAAAAAEARGADQIQRFEHSFYLNAFADHFLQDSFSGGHMGFNRPASSASASLKYHDRWNRDGRLVRNRRGNIWVAYGDGRLLTDGNRKNRKLVVEASVRSVLGLLTAFVTGRDDPSADAAVEDVIPASLYSYQSRGFVWFPGAHKLFPQQKRFEAFRDAMEAAPDDKAGAELGASTMIEGKSADENYLRATTAIANRAFKDYGLDLWWLFGGRHFDEMGSWQGLVPQLNWRLFTDSLRIFVGLGYIYRPENALAAGIGLKYQLASSFHGLVTHALALHNWARYTCVFLCATGLEHFKPRNSSFGIGYKLSVEAGPLILGIEIAPAVMVEAYKPSLGYMTGLSIEYLFSAAGGGPL